MDSLVLALRALWWRKGVSLVILAIAVFATASAAAGPVYLRAAGESLLSDTTGQASPSAVGIELRRDVSAQPDPLGALRREVAAAVTASRLPAYPTQVGALEYSGAVLHPDGTPLAGARVAHRQGYCAHLVLTSGRCPRAAREAVLTQDAATVVGVALGGRLLIQGFEEQTGPRTLVVVGIYAPRDVDEDYWSDRSYFASQFASADELASDAPPVDAFFVEPATFEGLSASTFIRVVVNLILDRGAVRLATMEQLEDGVSRLRTTLAVAGGGVDVDTRLTPILDDAREGERALAVPVLLVALQLIVLAWFVLFMVVANATEARGGEVALAKVRGLGWLSTLSFGLLETLLLVALAVPLGVLLGLAAVQALARSQLVEGTPVVLTAATWAAAGVVAVGALVAAALAAARTLRRPVLEQLRRESGGNAGRGGWVADSVVLTAAVAGLLNLYLGGALQGERFDALAVLAPGLLALGLALVGARLLPPLCRTLVRPTRASRRIGLFVAVRQISRRPAGLRVVVILATAFGLATFSVVGWSVLATNRADRALTEVGADRVLTVRPSPQLDLATVVRRLDPGGRQAMAVLDYSTSPGGSRSVRVLAVDATRLPFVGFWRDDFADQSIEALAARLEPPAPPPLLLSGTGVGLTLDIHQLEAADQTLVEVFLVGPNGQELPVTLGPAVAGQRRTYRGAVRGCQPGPCRVVAAYLTRGPGRFFPISGIVTFAALERREPSGAWRPMEGAFAEGRHEWASLNREDYAPPDTVTPGPQGVRTSFAAPEFNPVGLEHVDVPRPLRVVTTESVVLGIARGTTIPVSSPSGRQSLLMDASAPAVVVPRGGGYGMLVSLDYVRRSDSSPPSRALQQVWLTADAPVDFADRLERAGYDVVDVERAADRERALARQGPSLAFLLLLAGAGAAAVLAAGGTVLNLYQLARRRSFELAAMLAIGVRRRSLLGAVLLEQGLYVGAGTVLGVGVGLLGARIALPSVPQFTDDPEFPPLQLAPEAWVVPALVGVVVVVIALAVLGSALLLLRAAVPARLREAEQ